MQLSKNDVAGRSQRQTNPCSRHAQQRKANLITGLKFLNSQRAFSGGDRAIDSHHTKTSFVLSGDGSFDVVEHLFMMSENDKLLRRIGPLKPIEDIFRRRRGLGDATGLVCFAKPRMTFFLR